MPKGKLKKKNPALYEGSPEPKPSMARRSASHRRGGTHKVRDEHKTDSIYDDWNYMELLNGTKQRGLYRKDMKKNEMAWALKHDDEKKKRAEQDALLALQRRQQQAKEEEDRRAAEKQRQIEAKHKRRIEKERRRERDESVSDDTMSDTDAEAEENMRDEYKREKFGEALSDESWDSTSTESSAPSVHKVIKPDCRLRLFEWPHEKMPTSGQAMTPFSLLDPLPRHVPYAPLKITTTISRQKLVLPGLRYPPGVDPDFVPILNARTRVAARNGHLLSSLHKAIIESGTDWAQRTLVQGWNAHMYFHPGSRNETKALADTYTRWYLENRKLLRVKGKGDADPVDRAARHAQRQRNKAKKMAEVYEASLWRPPAMCYVPAYLDYGDQRGCEMEKDDRLLENLFFIRFPGCDVPHYYFWTRKREWGDPSFPNPAWGLGQLEEECTAEIDEDVEEEQRSRRKPLKVHRTRVRKPCLTALSTFPPSSPKTISDTITHIEHHLYTRGLSSTLSTYRHIWLENGKAHAWKTFAAKLPTLWPSGQIPDVPPVESRSGANVAIKLAMIDSLKRGGGTMLSPLHGGEAWTRDDDRVWEIVEVQTSGSESASSSSCRSTEDGEHDEDDENVKDNEEEPRTALEELGYETDDEALHRRCSVVNAHEDIIADPVVAWLEQIGPTFAPPTTPPSVQKVAMDLEEWEERYLQYHEYENSGACPFYCMQWDTLAVEDQATHMLSHSSMRPSRRRRPSASQYALLPVACAIQEAKFDGNPEIALRPEPHRTWKHHRPSAQTGSSVGVDESCYVSSRRFRKLRRRPDEHTGPTLKTRKRSFGSEDGLGFLDMYTTKIGKRRKRTSAHKPSMESMWCGHPIM